MAGGKFVFAGGDKLYVRGVTYGTFSAEMGRNAFPDHNMVAADFGAMAVHRINAIRTYVEPPRWVLDLAHDHGLRVLVGLPWEQHVAFLADRERARSIERRVREGVRACEGHPAILGYAIGNEIPASIVRWHGRRRIERFLERLYWAAKDEDPEGLVTYVNYPSTEYLQLPFADLICFNVFLEAEEDLEAYLSRLQNMAGDRPLLITELGLDSRRHGEEAQAAVIDWQIRTAFRAGCAGAFVFSWTDEWNRGGQPVDDWDFGLTTRRRSPKPALGAVKEAFAEVPFRGDVPWPRVSVVVCSHNGAATIGDCLAGVMELDYPDYEVIVVDDGSTDATFRVAQSFGARIVCIESQGLSAARNVGLTAATGEIVAYLDDDARPDPHWLRYVAATFLATPHAGVGGPNVAPPGERLLERCLAEAPGGPIHVLISDREAEHIPGCNMAFRKSALEAVDGFDRQFRIAGDDVDVCWRLRDQGCTLGFSPAAMVWHRRRPSIRAYLRQQSGYGNAEALLERKWPERYNRAGHLRWSGRVYGGRILRSKALRRWRIYYGTWGHGLFQSVYQRAPGTLSSLPLMPEWYLLLAVLAAASAYGVLFEPLFFGIPILGIPFTLMLFLVCAGVLVAQAVMSAWASLPSFSRSRAYRAGFLATMTLLYLLQPAARLGGRLRRGLTPWRLRGALGLAPPWPRRSTAWSEWWRSPAEWLGLLEAAIRSANAPVHRGGDYDRWDLEVRIGSLGSARVRMAVEEHGQGRQLVRFRVWPVWSHLSVALTAALAASFFLELKYDLAAGAVVAALIALLLVRAIREATGAIALLSQQILLVCSEELVEESAETGADVLPELADALKTRLGGHSAAGVDGAGAVSAQSLQGTKDSDDPAERTTGARS